MRCLIFLFAFIFCSPVSNAQEDWKALLDKAYAFSNEGNIDSAYYYYQEVYYDLDGREQMNFDYMTDYGYILYLNTLYREAESVYVKAFDLMQKPEQEILLHMFLGMNYQFSNNLSRAIKEYELAESLALKFDQKDALIQTKGKVAQTFQLKGDYERAKKIYEVVLAYYKLDMENARSEYFYYKNLKGYADTQLRLKKDLSVLSFYQEALDYYRSQEYRDEEISILLGMVWAYGELGFKTKALDILSEVESLSKNSNDGYLQLSILDYKTEYATDVNLAGRNHNKYVLLRDSLDNNQNSKIEDYAYIAYQTKQKEVENLEMALDLQTKEFQNVVLAGVLGTSILTMLGIFYVRKKRFDQKVFDLRVQKLADTQAIRDSFSKTLHDEVVSEMVFLRKKLAGHPELKRFEDLGHKIRGISHQIASVEENIDLKEAFSNLMVDYYDEDCKLRFKSFDEEDWGDTDVFLKKQVYLIVVEGIRNAEKHGKATNINIDLKRNKREGQLIIQDNGIGFDTARNGRGIGLKNMESRVRDLDGNMQVESGIGVGTKLELNFKIV